MPKTVSLILLSSFFSAAFAQQNHLMFFEHHLPQSNLTNPAEQAPCPVWIGIPVLSSIHYNYINTGFTYNDLRRQNGPGPSQLIIGNAVNELGKRNLVTSDVHLMWFGVGIKRKRWYYNFTVIEKIESPFTFTGDLARFAWSGNTPYEGQTISTKGTKLMFSHYREFAFGASKEIEPGYFIGGKVKVLFGKNNVTTKKLNVELYTDPHTFNIDVRGEVAINASVPVFLQQNEFGNIDSAGYKEEQSIRGQIFNRSNPGLAFDAGIVKPINDRLLFSASIIDLGFIYWRKNVINATANKTLHITGASNDSANGQLDFSNFFADSSAYEITNKPYLTRLPTQIHAGLEYQLFPRISAGILYSGRIYTSYFQNSLTGSLNFHPVKAIQLALGYSIHHRAWNSWAAGITLGRGPLQYYMYSDNVYAFFNPLDAKNINLRFGLNFNFGCRAKKVKPEREVPKGMSALPCPNIFIRRNEYKVKAEKKREFMDED